MVPSRPGCATQAPGSSRDQRTVPSLPQPDPPGPPGPVHAPDRDPAAGPGATATTSSTAAKDRRRIQVSDPRVTCPPPAAIRLRLRSRPPFRFAGMFLTDLPAAATALLDSVGATSRLPMTYGDRHDRTCPLALRLPARGPIVHGGEQRRRRRPADERRAG